MTLCRNPSLLQSFLRSFLSPLLDVRSLFVTGKIAKYAQSLVLVFFNLHVLTHLRQSPLRSIDGTVTKICTATRSTSRDSLGTKVKVRFYGID